MHKIYLLGCLVCVLILSTAAVDASQVEWQVRQTLTSSQPPVDMAVSGDGKYIYVLTGGGTIEVFDDQGKKIDTLEIGAGFTRVKAGSRDTVLYLQNEKDGTVKIVDLDFIADINVTGSPFEGPETAPVAVVVFSEFQ